MNATEPQTVLIGSFADHDHAERYVAALRRAGFPDAEIGVVAARPVGSPTEDAAVAGALAGGSVGVLAGLAASAVLVPGVGPLLAGGLLAGALGGAAVGAAAGGLLGALVGLGVSEEEAHARAAEVRAGRALVVVRSAGRYPEALRILRRCEAEAAPEPPRREVELVPLDELRGDGP
jgi:hypothetical protein